MIQDNNSPPKDKGRLRKTIRKGVAALLKDKTDVGKRVFSNSSIPPWEEELPVILVYARNEPATVYGQAPKEYRRDIDFVVEIIAKGPEVDEEGNEPLGQKSLEDILDDIAEQVEGLMSVDHTLGGVADDHEFTNTEMEFDGGGGLPIGSARLSFTVTYYTFYPRDSNQQALADFKTNTVKYHIGKVDDDTREAEDTVDLPQT